MATATSFATPRQLTLGSTTVVDGFHPAVGTWFRRRFPDGATPPQRDGWPHIAAGNDVLIAAPTGSGKTLAGFLMCINRLYLAHDAGEQITDIARVVYVSPLKALAVDIAENLQRPLREIADIARELGFDPPDIRVAVRTGDTPNAERARMMRKPPSFVVTTPESLYLLVTSASGRRALETIDTVIVDEIHAVARDKRGSHLALTLERLEALCPTRPAASASRPRNDRSKPSPACSSATRPLPQIVDSGHQRELDLAIELPDGELEAVTSAEQMADVLDRIAEHVKEHRTTLVFVNTRRMAERIAHQLGERLGDDVVAAHHGSLSKDRRARVEARLRAGDLSALVATASLELGIDIGPVELVCQIGSPRSIATFLQRVGRSNHSRAGVPKGRLYPLTRDELVECAALLAAVRAGKLDAIHMPTLPLDILSQQVIAEVGAKEWRTDDLFALVTRAAPYTDLTRAAFDEVITLAADGVQTGRGPRGRYLFHDAVNGEVRARKGARLAALTSGGAIPEIGDYRVVAEPDDMFIGTVNEDWAVESMAGDIFLLGTHSWQIRRVEAGVVRVRDAGTAPPTVPFWTGEAPARTIELSESVSELRARIDTFLAEGRPDDARAWLTTAAGVGPEATTMLVDYIAVGRAVLGVTPTLEDLVIERFFDETGGMQLVIHSPYGGRLNRAFGLALRKKFCRTFNFELQAAASDDAIVLSLGPHHSFPLDEVARYVHSNTVEDTLQQAVLDAPMFLSRWRWNLNRALIVLRFRGGRRNPPPIQRMEADDLMAALFPQAAACQENITGPIEIPDHLIVRQTVYDTLARGARRRRAARAVARASKADACACTPSTPRNPRCSRTRSSPRGLTHFSTTRSCRTAARTRCRCRAGSASTSPRSGASTTTPSPVCTRRSHPGPRPPTTCTTCCARSSSPTRARNGRSCSASSSRGDARSASSATDARCGAPPRPQPTPRRCSRTTTTQRSRPCGATSSWPASPPPTSSRSPLVCQPAESRTGSSRSNGRARRCKATTPAASATTASSGSRAAYSRACTRTRVDHAASASTPRPPRTSCASCCAGSTSHPERSSRAMPGSRPSSVSCKVGKPRRPRGNPSC